MKREQRPIVYLVYIISLNDLWGFGVLMINDKLVTVLLKYATCASVGAILEKASGINEKC